jgi:hypothetical protein
MHLHRAILVVTLAAGLTAVVPQASAGQADARHTESPPAELAPAIASALAPGGLRLQVSSVQLDFWYVKTLALKPGSTASSWTNVAEGSLIGAVRLHGTFRDVRGRVIKPGVYTMRYGIQPENGDHLGVSPFREFVLVSPAAVDTDVSPRGHQGTIDMSKQTAGGSHPTVWSIDPPSTAAPLASTHTNDLELTSYTMEVPVSREGAAGGALRFGLVLIGKIEA